MDEDFDTGDLFQPPEGFYPPTPPPTQQSYTLQSGKSLTIHLVGYNPLEGHHLWNGSRYVSKYFEEHISEVKDRTVLEIGAGAGLPSLVCAVLGARKVVCTDYPAPDLINNIKKNINWARELIADENADARVVAEGYAWGEDPAPLLAHLAPSSSEEHSSSETKFNVLVLADLLFKHARHNEMLKTIEMTLSHRRDSTAFVFFTSYRPWLRHKDLAFFDLARERGFVVEQIFEIHMDKPMFENDPGDLEVQKTCTGWTIRWPVDACCEGEAKRGTAADV